jgi:hypothetical protein
MPAFRSLRDYLGLAQGEWLFEISEMKTAASENSKAAGAPASMQNYHTDPKKDHAHWTESTDSANKAKLPRSGGIADSRAKYSNADGFQAHRELAL